LLRGKTAKETSTYKDPDFTNSNFNYCQNIPVKQNLQVNGREREREKWKEEERRMGKWRWEGRKDQKKGER
jgi:hypothetical protein